ncbi:MAG: hypothetical protein ACKPH7_28985, partial [Planktothrix sp.]|uniref:hypothetical protein n=1 Tax=Planktothrix sp. TaxID=3088171 RepID=UPI0038D4C404
LHSHLYHDGFDSLDKPIHEYLYEILERMLQKATGNYELRITNREAALWQWAIFTASRAL